MSETEAALAAADILNNIVGQFGGVIKELIRAGASSPLIGYVTSIIIVDLLEKQAKILSSDSAALIKGVATAAIGIDLAADIIQPLAAIIPKFSRGATADHGILAAPQVFAPVYIEAGADLSRIPNIRAVPELPRKS